MGVKSVLTIPKDSTKLVKTRIELILYTKKRNENYIDINNKKTPNKDLHNNWILGHHLLNIIIFC